MNLANLLRHVSLKHIRLQKAHLLIAVSGICLGVAALVSIDIVNRSVLHSFEESIDHIMGRAALQIVGGESGFPEKMLELVQNVPGVEYAVPVIETNANIFGGSERSLMILGVDVLQDHKVRSYDITDESSDIPDPLLFLARRDSILLTRAMAEREGIKIDQEIRLQTVQGIKTFYVRGFLNPDGPARVAGGDIAVMDIFAAQMVFGKDDRIDRIDVSFLPGETLDTMKERIQRVLPEGYTLDTPASRTRQVEILLSRFRKTIGLISLMATFVGMYLIYNAVSISVVQRKKEIGILRALGAKRSEIIGLFLGETGAMSILGSLLGIGLGFLFARLTVGVVAQSVTDIYLKTSVSDLDFSWMDIFRDAGIGILASLAAAVLPALSSARITPISAIRAVPYSEDGVLYGRKIKVASAISILLAALIMAVYKSVDGTSSIRSSVTTFSAVIFLMLGVSLFTPVFLKGFMSFFHNLFSSRLGVQGRLAGMNLQKGLSRNAVAVAAIFLSISLFVSSANMVNALSRSMFDWLDSTVRADILVSSGHPLAVGGTPYIPMPPEMLKGLEEIPGVLSAEPYRKAYVNYNGRKVLLEMFDAALRMEYCPGMFAEGTREDAIRLMPDQDNVLVNEGFATRYGLKPGDSIFLPTPNGQVQFGVAAIAVGYSSDSGLVWMDVDTYRRHWRDYLVDIYELRVQPGVDVSSVQAAILDRMGKERKLFALDAAEFKDEVKKMLNRSSVVFSALNIITLLIAGFGIVVTLLASVLERTREIGVLRSIGMKKSHVSGIVIIESALIGAAGGLLGSATGLLVGWIELEGFFRSDFGASIVYHIHFPSIACALFLSITFSALAALYPARRAAKTNIVEALSYE
jgi:putative ABC transport system permease protein